MRIKAERVEVGITCDEIFDPLIPKSRTECRVGGNGYDDCSLDSGHWIDGLFGTQRQRKNIRLQRAGIWVAKVYAPNLNRDNSFRHWLICNLKLTACR